MNVAILGGLAGKRSNWLSGYSYRKSFTYSRASGAVENYQVKILVAEAGDGVLFSDCESTTGWSASNSAVTTDTGCVGTYCLKFTGGDRGGGDPYYVVKYLSPYQNWVAAGYKTMTLWHKCSDGATTFQVRITSNGTNLWNVTSGSEWAKTTLDLSAPDTYAGALDNVEAVAIRNLASTTVYWDEMRLGWDTDCNAHCLSTFNDLRFTDSDGNELDYWIESISGETPNQVATVWVELDSVGTDATTFYMYYGNADAVSASSGANTFIFFDDFDSLDNGDLNGQNGWSGDADFDVQDSTYYHGSKAVQVMGASDKDISHALSVTSYNCWIEASIRYHSWVDYSVIFYLYEGATQITGIGTGSTSDYISHLRASAWEAVAGSEVDTWYKCKIALDSASTHKVWIDDVLQSPANNSNINNVTSAVDTVTLQQYTSSGANPCYFDVVKVGHYLATEPAFGSWGEEEAA